MDSFYNQLQAQIGSNKKLLAVLIDPEKFDISQTAFFLKKIPSSTTHIFVGGSTVSAQDIKAAVKALKLNCQLPIILFPGHYEQIAPMADVLLFLTLLSGRNPEYLIGQQVKSIQHLKNSKLEIIPTGYILIDGGNISSVSKVTHTLPIPQHNVSEIVDTALAGQYMGSKLIYLEAGSGAKFPVSTEIIRQVKSVIEIPLIVGGGIKTELQKQQAYNAGADMVVMGTVFETNSSNKKSIYLQPNKMQ